MMLCTFELEGGAGKEEGGGEKVSVCWVGSWGGGCLGQNRNEVKSQAVGGA